MATSNFTPNHLFPSCFWYIFHKKKGISCCFQYSHKFSNLFFLSILVVYHIWWLFMNLPNFEKTKFKANKIWDANVFLFHGCEFCGNVIFDDCTLFRYASDQKNDYYWIKSFSMIKIISYKMNTKYTILVFCKIINSLHNNSMIWLAKF